MSLADVVFSAQYLVGSNPSVGMVVSLSADGTTYIPFAGGLFAGVVTSASSVTGSTNFVQVQVSGTLPPSITGLGSGSASPVIASPSTSALVRKASPVYGVDAIVGDCDTAGNLFLTAQSRLVPSSAGTAGATGPAGPTGPTGPTGPQGPTGPGGGFTAGGDLAGTSTSQQVQSLTSASPIPVTTALSFGTNPAQSGAIRLNSAMAITGRNVANTADMHLVQTDGANDVIVGDYTAVSSVGVRAGAEFDIGVGGSINQLRMYSGYGVLSVPILGDTGNASPYKLHGEVTASLTASRAALSSEYCRGLIVLTPNAGSYTYTFPAPGAGGGYWQDIALTAAFSVIVSNGANTATIPATVGLYRVWITSSAVYVK